MRLNVHGGKRAALDLASHTEAQLKRQAKRLKRGV